MVWIDRFESFIQKDSLANNKNHYKISNAKKQNQIQQHILPRTPSARWWCFPFSFRGMWRGDRINYTINVVFARIFNVDYMCSI